jgi:hypothetical protein
VGYVDRESRRSLDVVSASADHPCRLGFEVPFWLVRAPREEETRERIRQIEAKALRKLQHPSRSNRLKSFKEN